MSEQTKILTLKGKAFFVTGDKVVESEVAKLNIHKVPTDIVVFVPGTTDPINTSGLKHQALNSSYFHDELLGKVGELKRQFLDLHILKEHLSWSGDNNTDERIKAADRLLDLLLRYYPGYDKNNVHFHLIGHSHGGNVINQFTELIATDKRFPEKWKIKSITYLSTPFFKEKHQLNHVKLHKYCKIINVYNEYDITQRFVADFSLVNLEYVLASLDSDILTKTLKKIRLIIASNVYAPLTETFNTIDNHTEGPLIWARTALLLNNVAIIFSEILKTINNFKIETLLAEKNELIRAFTALHNWATTTAQVFERNSNNRNRGYDSWDFGTDLNLLPELQVLNNLLQIENGVEDSNILGILATIFSDNSGVTDSIDDTSWTPKNQIKDISMEPVNITTEDEYHTRNRKTNYDGFVSGVENAIKNNNLREVLMRLLSQLIAVENIDSIIDSVDKVEYIIKGQADNQLKRLRKDLLPVYRRLIDQFNANLIAEEDIPTEENEEENENRMPDNAFSTEAQEQFNEQLAAIEIETNTQTTATVLVHGSIHYLATVSHSLSHTRLWEGVEKELRKAFSSGKNPGYKKK